MTITISASGIALDGPLVAGEKVAVSASGLSLAAEDKPTLALLARFPDALLASAELAEDAETPGTWTGELDTATKQTARFFATARADERRDAALELVAGRVSLARLTVPMANSALCPKPDGAPFASPVYVPVPGPQGPAGISTNIEERWIRASGEQFTPEADTRYLALLVGSYASVVFSYSAVSLPSGKAATVVLYNGKTSVASVGFDSSIRAVIGASASGFIIQPGHAAIFSFFGTFDADGTIGVVAVQS